MIGNGSTLGKILGDGAGKKLESMGASENTAQLIGDTAKGLTASGVKGVENSARSPVSVVRVSGRIESKRLDK